MPRGVVVPFLFAAVGFAVLVGLGTWQVERKAWKEVLIETLRQRTSAAPISLPPRGQWAELRSESDEFKRVKFRALFEHSRLRPNLFLCPSLVQCVRTSRWLMRG